MASEVRTIPLAEYCLRITKGTTPTTLGRPFEAHGVNFVKSEAITPDGRIDPSTFAFIDVETHNALSRSILQENDVLFSMAGVYLGKTAVVTSSILPANTNQAVGIIRVDQTKANPRFIHYALSSPSIRSLVRRSVAQSAQPNFNLRDIGDLPIPKMPLRDQQAISSVLGTLDDKVELNRRMSETLEDIARAMFKSWFVDFDPARAKAEGLDLGINEAIAGPYSSAFEDSEIGPVPTGWRTGRLADVVEYLREQLNPLSSPATLFHHYSIPAFDTAKWPKSEVGANIKSLKSKVPPNVVLLSKLNPEIERVWLVDIQPNDLAVCSTEFLVLSPRAPFGRAYAYCLARSFSFRQQIGGLVTGTSKSHQRAQADAILQLPVILPPSQIVQKFEAYASPLLSRSLTCYRETRTLHAIRDTLLPRLVFGELRIADGERITRTQM